VENDKKREWHRERVKEKALGQPLAVEGKERKGSKMKQDDCGLEGTIGIGREEGEGEQRKERKQDDCG
jgi:hypothetical protein